MGPFIIMLLDSLVFTTSKFFIFKRKSLNIGYVRVLDSPIVGFRWIDLHLFLRLIVAGTLTMCIFNVTNRLFDAIYSTVSLFFYYQA